MLTFKKSKKNVSQSIEHQPEFRPRSAKPSSELVDDALIDRNKVNLLARWLDHLNSKQLISITDQNDIVIMAGDSNDPFQQIFINHNHVDAHMQAKTDKSNQLYEEQVIQMVDIASILLQYKYVKESLGQFIFSSQNIPTDRNQSIWLRSIVHSVQPDAQSHKTYVKLFDGNEIQLLTIPGEYMAPTDDINTVAKHLLHHGQIRYDINTATYVYKYIQPDPLLDEKTNSPERIAQRQMLSFYIHHIHVDERTKLIELEFQGNAPERLIIPSDWYYHIHAHNFDRFYIIDALLANGGSLSGENFIFMGHVYSLRSSGVTKKSVRFLPPRDLKIVNLSVERKIDFVSRYIDLMNEKNAVKLDKTKGTLLLEDIDDGRQLYFTKEHTEQIRHNRFRRADVIELLTRYAQIKEDERGRWFLYYNNQFLRFPYSLQNNSDRPQSLKTQSPRHTQGISYTTERVSTRPLVSNVETRFWNRRPEETQAEFQKRYHDTIDYMYRHNFITWDRSANLIKFHFADRIVSLPINHLRSILNLHVLSCPSNVDNTLPFKSHQLSQWLLNNSYLENSLI